MKALIIDAEAKADIRRVIEYAEQHVFTVDDLLDIKNKQGTIAGDRDEFVCHLPLGYRVVYSIEQQPSGRVRHLSVSVGAEGRLPAVPAVEEIIKLFGFENELENCLLGIESISLTHDAINVLEIIK